jgi:replicative DNA helicase
VKQHSPQAERALVTAVLLTPEVIDEIDVPTADFFEVPIRYVMESMRKLRSEGLDPSDVALLQNALGTRWEASAETVGRCAVDFCSTASVPQYQRLVREYALRRRARSLLSELAGQEGVSGEELLGRAVSALNGLAETGGTSTAVSLKTALVDDYRAFQGRLALKESTGSAFAGVPTGVGTIDRLIGGLSRGSVSIIAGRPSMGKSSLARTIAFDAALRGLGVHIFSLEDSRAALVERAISSESGVAVSKLRTMNVTPEEIYRVSEARERLAKGAPRLLIDDRVCSAPQIAAAIRRGKRSNATEVVVVDYVQLIRDSAVGADPRSQVDSAITALAQVARSEGVALVVVSQLSRAPESRANPRPLLSDLRESGTLEQVADCVLMLFRDEYYSQERSEIPGIVEVLVRKNKSGATGTAACGWDGETTTVRELTIAQQATWRAFQQPAQAQSKNKPRGNSWMDSLAEH